MRIGTPLFVRCLLATCLLAFASPAWATGEIIFSATPIDPSAPADITDGFAAGQPIYAMAKLDQDLLGLIGKSSAKKVDVEVFMYELKPPLYDYQQPSEVQLQTCSLVVSGDALGKDYLPVDVVPDPASMSAYGNPQYTYKKFGPEFDGPVKLAAKLAELEPGEHTIVVKLRANYDWVSEGTFTIAGDDFSGYDAMSTSLNAAAVGIATGGTGMPASARNDPALVAEMTAAFMASQTYKDRVKGEVMAVVIIDPDWMIRRNELTGVILHRYIRAAIAVKNADGSCTLWNLVTFQQDYASDAFQATRFDGVGDPVPIPCENVR